MARWVWMVEISWREKIAAAFMFVLYFFFFKAGKTCYFFLRIHQRFLILKTAIFLLYSFYLILSNLILFTFIYF